MKRDAAPSPLLQAAALARIDELRGVTHMTIERAPDAPAAGLSPSLSDHPISTSIPVADLARAETWYRDKLGFERPANPPLPHHDEGIFFDAGAGTRFYLFPTHAGAGAGHTIAEFQVGDAFDAVIDALRGRGVIFKEYDLPGLKTENGIAEFTGPQGHRAAWFKDSEGNVQAIGSYGGASPRQRPMEATGSAGVNR
jgi:catechol 2,3-dioxygenase-like lactoylglutathione lyase family enzyme